MNEFDELKDIVMNNELDNSNKNKKRLILVAFLVIIFLVVLVVMKLVKDSTTSDMSSQMEIPQIEAITSNVDNQVFEQIPIQNDFSTEDDLVVEESLLVNKTEDITTNEKEQTLEEIIAKQKSKLIEVEKNKQKETEVVAPTMVAEVTKKVVIKAKEFKNPFISSVKTPINNLIVGSYIQVGAIHGSKPNKKFLNTLKAKNYTYRLYDVKVKGKVYTKVLIGPYRTRSELSIALQEIKSSVNSSAFIYRIKE